MQFLTRTKWLAWFCGCLDDYVEVEWMPEDCGGLGSGSEWVLVAVYAGYSHGCRGAKSKEGWPTTLILSVKWSSTKYVVINKALNNDEVFYFLSVKKRQVNLTGWEKAKYEKYNEEKRQEIKVHKTGKSIK